MAFAAFFEEFAEGCEFVFEEWSVELEVERHAGAAELVGDEDLHVAAGVLDSAFFEVAGATFDGFEDGAHWGEWSSGGEVGGQAGILMAGGWMRYAWGISPHFIGSILGRTVGGVRCGV